MLSGVLLNCALLVVFRFGTITNLVPLASAAVMKSCQSRMPGEVMRSMSHMSTTVTGVS